MRLKLLVFFIFAVLLTACVQAPTDKGNASDPNRKIRIGFAMDTVKEERWQKDRDLFQKHCQEIGAECSITVANNDASRQANDVDNLLTKGIDVLVIAPHDATQAASMVEKAKAQGIPVISYDRLINSDKIDLYISHQVPVIGRKQAEYALQHAPKGNYVMVYGASTDNNAIIMKNAQLEVLKPAVDRGDITLVAQQNATDWRPEEALKIVENALTQHNNNIVAVVASNDGMAGGAIQALTAQNLAGKVIVTGQDAELAALQRIAQGTQSMTVYKPIQALAYGAVDAAIKLAKKEPLGDAKPFMNDSIKKEIPAILLEVQVVDKDNLMDTVIKDGYAKYEDVYANVPADKRPPQK